MNELLYDTIDMVLFPFEINQLLDEAIVLCPVMKKDNKKMYPANIKRLFPNSSDEFQVLGAELLNDLAFNYI